MMDGTAIGLFLLAAVALLGSPGPGIAALLAVTRGGGLRAGLRYYAGLQVGLALAAAISAAGLFSLLAAFPVLLKAASVAAVLYLVWLAWKIGSAPVSASGSSTGASASPVGGFFLGITNPKAYLAFASLMASTTLIGSGASADAALKWLLIVAVILVVDMAWVLLGAVLHRAVLPPRIERAMNIVFAAAILAAALPALF
jgi:threonine/homoserine/homoserine lactone efflux protein